MLKGYLDPNGWGKTVIVYGSYEIKVRDSNGKVIYDEDAYCTSSKTIKFKVTKNQTYTVQVYFWNATTTAKSYYNKGKMTWKSGSLSQINGSRWWVLPSITAVSSTNGTFKAK